MSSKEEQANELEALQAIFMEQFVPDDASPETKFSIAIKPTSDDSEKCWVSIKLCVEWPANYPLEAGPKLAFEEVVGLTDKQVEELRGAAEATAAENAGAPAIYAVAERVREWLIEHNEQPSDGSAFSEMMRRQRDKEKGGGVAGGGAAAAAADKAALYDRENDPSIKKKHVISAAEVDEAVRRKKYGTPVTPEAFFAWREKFDAEMEAKAAEDAAKGIEPDMWMAGKAARGRLTGKQMFERDASLATSDVGLAAAAERAAAAAAAAAAGGGAAGGAAGGSAGAAAGGDGAEAFDASVFLAEGDLDDLEDDEDDEDYEEEDEDDDDEDYEEDDE